MLVTLTGLKLPADVAATANLDSGVAPTQLSGVRVLFNGTPGPVLSTSADEVAAMVPYELAGGTHVTVTLEYLGQAAEPALVAQAATRPELVPVPEAPGAVARHPDGMPVSADWPAEAGSVIEITATGLGLTDPPLASTAVQRQAVPVAFVHGTLKVLYNGTPAEVLFTGPKPGQAPGLIQANIRVPADAGSGTSIEVKLEN
jgi:uncharacterized protein (TIGR03437 family)